MEVTRYLLLFFISSHLRSAYTLDCPDHCTCIQSQGTYTINCAGADLEEVLNDIDSRANLLDLSNNGLQNFDQLSRFQHLKSLNLQSNKFRVFHSPRMASLEEIDLSDNDIEDLDNITIYKTQLKVLLLQNNPIREAVELRSNTLELLDISYCRIVYLRTSLIYNLKNLKVLKLVNNPIKVIDELFSDSLKSLVVRGIKVRFIRAGHLEGLRALELLDMSMNRNFGSMIHGEPLAVENVRMLDISYGDIPHLGFDNLPNLEYIYMGHNRVNILSETTFRNNDNVKWIDLSGNQIQDIDRNTFQPLVGLVYLDLSFNMITNMSWTLHVKAQNLNLSGNNLTYLGLFRLERVLDLDLSKNNIKKMFDLVNSTPQLLTLDLSKNPLPVLDRVISNTLTTLRLSDCGILAVDAENFKLLPLLKTLVLTGNKIKSLSVYSFSSNSLLSSLDLQNNPWNCDCADSKFKELYFYLTDKKLSKNVELMCAPEVNYTWNEFCYSRWQTEVELAQPSGRSFYYVISFVLFLILLLFCGFSWKFFRSSNTDTPSDIFSPDQISYPSRESIPQSRRTELYTFRRNSQHICNPQTDRPPTYEEAVLQERREYPRAGSPPTEPVVLVVVNNNQIPA